VKISWNSIKISIAGAKLTHLVQKDRIWDHGSMIEQARNIFLKVKKAKDNGHIEDLKKFLTARCYEKLQQEIDALNKKGKKWVIKNAMVKEIAVIEVSRGNDNRPDCFTALIKAMGIEFIADRDELQEMVNYSDRVRNLSEQWSFVRQGDWWLLDGIRAGKVF